MRRAALGVALATLIPPQIARADEASQLPLKLTWNAPATCPTAEDVADRVRHLLSKPVPQGATVTATARVRPVADDRVELVLTTEVADARGTRTVRAGSCTALAEAAAVFIALAIDSTRATRPPAELAPSPEPELELELEPQPEAPAQPPPSPKPSSPPVAQPVAAEHQASHDPVRPGAGVYGVFDVGALPDASAGLALNVHLRIARIRAGLVGSVWHAQEPTFDEKRGAGASFQMRTAGLFGCYVVPLGQLDLGGCATVEARAVEAVGVGIRNPEVARAVWPAAGAGGLAEARVTRWLGVVARVDLLAAIGAPNIALATDSGNAALFQPAVFSVRSGLGVEIVLP